MINIKYILLNIARLIINFMNTEVLRKLKTIMEITRTLLKIGSIKVCCILHCATFPIPVKVFREMG